MGDNANFPDIVDTDSESESAQHVAAVCSARRRPVLESGATVNSGRMLPELERGALVYSEQKV